MELNETELEEERRRKESEERWKEREEERKEQRWKEREGEILLRDFLPDESKYQLPMSKFTRILVR